MRKQGSHCQSPIEERAFKQPRVESASLESRVRNRHISIYRCRHAAVRGLFMIDHIETRRPNIPTSSSQRLRASLTLKPGPEAEKCNPQLGPDLDIDVTCRAVFMSCVNTRQVILENLGLINKTRPDIPERRYSQPQAMPCSILPTAHPHRAHAVHTCCRLEM